MVAPARSNGGPYPSPPSGGPWGVDRQNDWNCEYLDGPADSGGTQSKQGKGDRHPSAVFSAGTIVSDPGYIEAGRQACPGTGTFDPRTSVYVAFHAASANSPV